MSSNYISTETINNMNMTDLVQGIQEFVFFERKNMKEGKYKNTQDMLKRLYEIGEEKTFENQCKKYYIFFIEVCPVINLPLNGRSVCRGLEDCCQATEVRIKCNTMRFNNVYLHPLLVRFLNSSDFLQNTNSIFISNLEKYLRRPNAFDGEVDPLMRFLCTQFHVNIQTIIDAAETHFEFSENIRCGGSACLMSGNIGGKNGNRKYFKGER